LTFDGNQGVFLGGVREPLSERLRPRKLEEIVGQDHLLGPDGIVPSIIRHGKPLSIILWGPPGVGKTTIARLYAEAFEMPFESISAIFSGVGDLKRILRNESILLFVDEIHRFNKAQQDAFLPFLENGRLILVGSTVENPSFYLNKALLSRLRVLKLEPLGPAALDQILQRYEKGREKFEPSIREYLIYLAHGDGRYLLNLVENLESLDSKYLQNLESLQSILQERAPLFDKGADQHYDLISALHKSVRGSDPNAALYWLNRLLIGGEDPLFLARRLIRMASEDVGLADPQALQITIAARDAYQMLGSPEGELALAEATVYLALAPKSNAVYTAMKAANASASETHQLAPPMIIVNGATAMMRSMGYGEGYVYDPDTPQGFSGQNYFPPGMERQEFYHPVERGFERDMKKRMEYFEKLRAALS